MSNIKNWKQFNESMTSEVRTKEDYLSALENVDSNLKKVVGDYTIVKVVNFDIATKLSSPYWGFYKDNVYTRDGLFPKYLEFVDIFYILNKEGDVLYAVNLLKENSKEEDGKDIHSIYTYKFKTIKEEEELDTLNSLGLSLEDFNF